jgi:hypothetical protein
VDRLRGNRPSPALVISLVSLFVALGGSSYAAIKIGSRNLKTGAVGTRAIKNNTVRGKDLRNGSATGRDLKNETVTGDDLKDGTVSTGDVGSDTLTGADIDEYTLGEVLRAGSARSAESAELAITARHATTADIATTAGDAVTVGGRHVRQFYYHFCTGGPDSETLPPIPINGVQFAVSCDSNAPNFDATNVSGGEGTFAVDGFDFGTSTAFHQATYWPASPAGGSAQDVTPGGATKGRGTATMSTGGDVVTLDFAYIGDPTPGTLGCQVWGTVVY